MVMTYISYPNQQKIIPTIYGSELIGTWISNNINNNHITTVSFTFI